MNITLNISEIIFPCVLSRHAVRYGQTLMEITENIAFEVGSLQVNASSCLHVRVHVHAHVWASFLPPLLLYHYRLLNFRLILGCRVLWQETKITFRWETRIEFLIVWYQLLDVALISTCNLMQFSYDPWYDIKILPKRHFCTLQGLKYIIFTKTHEW